MTARMELQDVRVEHDLLRGSPAARASPQIPPIQSPARPLDERRGQRQDELECPLQRRQQAALRQVDESMGMPRECVRVEAPDKRVGGEEVVEQVVADNRLEMDHLVCGEEVLLFEGETRVGQYQVGADDAPSPEAFGQHQDGAPQTVQTCRPRVTMKRSRSPPRSRFRWAMLPESATIRVKGTAQISRRTER